MLLEVKDLHISYGDIEAVSGVGFHLEKGELISIIGANGAGKTSILSSLMGILPARRGSIVYKGQDITAMPSHERAKIGIRMVPERSRLFPRLTVHENLLTGVYGLRKKVRVDERIAWLEEDIPYLAGEA